MSRFKIVSSTCNTHKDEKVTAFCQKHCKTLCLKCVLQDHAKCVAGQCVDDVRATIEESVREIPNMISSSEHLTVVLNDWKERNEESLKNLEKSEEAMHDGIEKLKISLIAQIEELSRDSLEVVKSVVKEQRRVLQHDHDVIEGFKEDMTETRAFVDELNSGESVPIGKVKEMMEKFSVLETKLNATDQCEGSMKLSFKTSEEVDYVRKHLLSFGELCFNDSKESNTNASVVQLRNNIQLDPNTSATESDDFVLTSHENQFYDNGYVGIHYETLPPPLPSSHPPVGSFPHTLHERHDNTRVESMPTPLLSEHMEGIGRPVTLGSPLDETDRPKLSMPPLPKRRHSHLKQQRGGLSEKNGEKMDSTTRLSQLSDSFVSETPSTESITKGVEHVDGADNISQSSPAAVDDNVFNNESQIINLDEMNKSQNDNQHVKWQTGSFSSTDSQIQDQFDYTKLKPPRSHTFMWSSSSSTKSNHVRDSGIHVSNTDICRTPDQSPRPWRKASSELDKTLDCTGMSNFTYDLPKNLDEPLKSLSHSDLPNLQDFREISRTASDKSINWDKYGEEKDEIEFQKPLQNYSHSDSNHSRVGKDTTHEPNGSDTHLHKLKMSEISPATKRSTLGPRSLPGSGSMLNHIQPCVVKEKKSDQCRNFKLPDVTDSAGHSGRHHHCTLTGIAITAAGHLLVCDFENHLVQHFNSSGVLVSDCSVQEPFSCCAIRDELVAVTSKSKKLLSIFELSETTMAFRQKREVGLVTEVYGVGYADGFFAVCCRDQVTLLTEDLQPYCEVKPLMITSKKRSTPYFSDVRYVAIEMRNSKILLYATEHNVNRITCLSVDKTFKYRKEWESKVAKPRSLVISDECLLIAAKGKIVVLGSSTGERMREIHSDVPAHPVHMVLHDNWLYMSKSAVSNTESRILRKIRLQN